MIYNMGKVVHLNWLRRKYTMLRSDIIWTEAWAESRGIKLPEKKEPEEKVDEKALQRKKKLDLILKK